MRHHDIIVAVRQIRRKSKEWSQYNPKMDYAITAGVSSLSSRIERSEEYILDRLGESGWACDGPEHSRKLVRIELPDDVQVGEYVIGRSTIVRGPYGQHSARDGMGATVFVYCRQPIVGITGDEERVIDAAIESGICASVPTKGGERVEIPVQVTEISDIYDCAIPSNWEPIWEDVPLNRLKRTRITHGMTAAELAEKSGVNIRQIQRVESGDSEAANLTAKNLLALADALGVDPRELI